MAIDKVSLKKYKLIMKLLKVGKESIVSGLAGELAAKYIQEKHILISVTAQ